jgi:hypothetical protein
MVTRQKVAIISGVAGLMLLASCGSGNAPFSVGQMNGTNANQTGCIPLPDQNLVAYWPIDELSGTAVLDNSGNGHDGVMTGNAQRTRGVSGNALLNKGRNSGIDVPDNSAFELTNGFTLSMWVRIDGWISGQGLVFFRGDSRPGYDPYLLAVDYPGKTLRFQIQDNATSRAGGNVDSVKAPVDSGVWFQVTAVFDTKNDIKTLALFIDGKLIEQKVTAIAPFAQLDVTQRPGLGIGHHAMRGSNDYGFLGAVDEVKIYSTALSPVETPIVTPVVTPIVMSIETPVVMPIEMPVEMPVVTPVVTPIVMSIETPVVMPFEMPVESAHENCPEKKCEKHQHHRQGCH